eukprot:2111171-Rhodomonas_salina.1
MVLERVSLLALLALAACSRQRRRSAAAGPHERSGGSKSTDLPKLPSVDDRFMLPRSPVRDWNMEFWRLKPFGDLSTLSLDSTDDPLVRRLANSSSLDDIVSRDVERLRNHDFCLLVMDVSEFARDDVDVAVAAEAERLRAPAPFSWPCPPFSTWPSHAVAGVLLLSKPFTLPAHAAR